MKTIPDVIRSFFIVIFTILTSGIVFATHNRAGEITYRHISNLTYEATILTYTFLTSPADRPELVINWGDGTSDTLNRSSKTDLTSVMRRNTYTGRHTYTGPGTYLIFFEDPNRNGGVQNIPNSIDIPFYVETKLVINPFLGYNSSPTLLNPPIDMACLQQTFIHNPGAFDVDGDSLSYSLVNCKGTGGLDISNYIRLESSTALNVYTSRSLTINPTTGDLLWDSPIKQGEYNIAILIREWRNGVEIGSIIRDIQVNVVICYDLPPVISDIKDTCIIAGNSLNLNITAVDPDVDVRKNTVTLTASGGPLILKNSPATFPQPIIGIGKVTSVFSWNTNCSHINKQPYQVVFKAVDNYRLGNNTPAYMVDYKTLQITIICPPITNVVANSIGNNNYVSWGKTICTNAIGYKIYRRIGNSGFVPNYCQTGVPASTNYAEIADITNINDTNFVDTNNGKGMIYGYSYCYIIISYFGDGAESKASAEVCTSLKREVPIITNISVTNTDVINGKTYIAWSKPTEIDTNTLKGGFTYLIYRTSSKNPSKYTLIDSTTNINDTIFNDNNLNTDANQYIYKINLVSTYKGKRIILGSTYDATSIYTSLMPTDNALIVSWNLSVPWENQYYVIYKYNDITTKYDSIGTSKTNTYTDTNLVNGKQYCYMIKSYGKYSINNIVYPIINYSQKVCGKPTDNIAPCSPLLKVYPDCDNTSNRIVWNKPKGKCGEDIIEYKLYFAQYENDELKMIYNSKNSKDTSYLHYNINSIAGCYAVSAIDSFMNESAMSEKICRDIDSCYSYRLPNVFTPDNNGYNDLLRPFPYKFVSKINLTIFNRWGKIVFTTEDPDIKWDGTNKYSKLMCADGVYFYICDVYEVRLKGIVKRTIKGFVTIFK